MISLDTGIMPCEKVSPLLLPIRGNRPLGENQLRKVTGLSGALHTGIEVGTQQMRGERDRSVVVRRADTATL